MKRQLFLSLALLVPAGIMAQENLTPRLETPVMLSAAAPALPTSTSADAAPDASPQPAFPQRQTRAKPAAAKNDTEVKRPKSEGSMVGYIDNAIIASQFRVRFDAAFDDRFPDLAEFFYAKCSCYSNLPGTPIYDPNAPGPGLGVPTKVDFQQLYFLGEYAPISRFSAFVEVPFRWLQPQGFKAFPPFPPFGSQSGISDVRLGIKLGLVASAKRSVTVQLRSTVPSGDASKGLGTNNYTIEPALLWHERVTPRFALEAQLGDNHPIDGSRGVPTASSKSFAGDVFFYGIGPSYELIRTENFRIAPVVELVGWHVLGGFETNPASAPYAADDVSGLNIVNMKFGARTSVGAHNSVYIGYGHVLTTAHWYHDIVRVEYRYSF